MGMPFRWQKKAFPLFAPQSIEMMTDYIKGAQDKEQHRAWPGSDSATERGKSKKVFIDGALKMLRRVGEIRAAERRGKNGFWEHLR